MRTIAALLISAAPAFAATLPSGLSDPLANKATCLEFAGKIDRAEGDITLHHIAFMEGMIAHDIYDDTAILAKDALRQNPENNEVNAALVAAVCRSIG